MGSFYQWATWEATIGFKFATKNQKANSQWFRMLRFSKNIGLKLKEGILAQTEPGEQAHSLRPTQHDRPSWPYPGRAFSREEGLEVEKDRILECSLCHFSPMTGFTDCPDTFFLSHKSQVNSPSNKNYSVQSTLNQQSPWRIPYGGTISSSTFTLLHRGMNWIPVYNFPFYLSPPVDSQLPTY